ncbi:DUF6653 family protein [Dinoroseobacter sp. S124A]|uniref:DUF6653 family protein n=1 Tax=Dinoroseobacter sp. S124A TaxID=3415128 RepID=UPI003C7D00B7
MADLFDRAERLMGMDDRVWRCHANPLSVATRFSVLPLLALAIWSRIWLGWGALLPVALVLVWTWANPRAFAEPRSFASWGSRAVLGERIFLNHRAEIPAHHRRVALCLGYAAALGALVLGLGLCMLWADWVVFGIVLTALPKTWFCDRMVWIHDDWVRAGKAVPGLTAKEIAYDRL